MAFNAKTYRINKYAREAYRQLEVARSERAAGRFCDPVRVGLYVRLARSDMRMHLIMRGDAVQPYPINR